MKVLLRSFLYLLFVSVGLSSVRTQTNTLTSLTYSPLTTAVPFAAYLEGAKLGGFGAAGIGAPANVYAPFFNIAKTSHIAAPFSITANYAPLLTNLQIPNYALYTLSSTYRIRNTGYAISVFGKYLNFPSMDITDIRGELLAQSKPVQGLFGIGFSTRISRHLSVGVAGRFIYSDLGSDGSNGSDNAVTLSPATALAVDLGIEYIKELNDNTTLTTGLSVTNLGNKIDYTKDGRFAFIPADLGLGIGLAKRLSKHHNLHIALDLHKLLVPTLPADTSNGSMKKYYEQSIFSSWFTSFSDAKGGVAEELKEINAHIGFEYVYKNLLFLKLGYIYQNPEKGNGSLVTMGFTIRYRSFDLDFAYGAPTYNDNLSNTSPLANSVRFGVVYQFLGE